MEIERVSRPIMPFRMAAFHLDARALRSESRERLLDFALSLATGGGDGGPETGGCSEFTCNTYSPPPPDQQ